MSALFLKIFNMSISASYLILAVLLARLLLKKAPKWINPALWAIVGLRLVCPFSLESALSLIPSAHTLPENIALSPSPAVNTGFQNIDQALNPILQQAATPQVGACVNPMQIYLSLAAWVWILGLSVMLLYTVISYFRLDLKMETAVRYWGNVYQSENADSPFVLGLFRPRIYLPFSLDEKTMEQVIAHEEAHIRRRDHWWKPLGFFMVSIHWFNPLIWLSYVLLCRDIELACDENVIRSLDRRQRADYSEALLVCSLHRRPISPCPLAFGEVGVKGRVKSILHYRKPGFWVLLLSLVVCMILAACFLTNPKDEETLPVESLPQETMTAPVRTETQPTEATTASTEWGYEADAAARGVWTTQPEEPYLAVYRVDPALGEVTEYIPLTADLVQTIQAQPLESLHRGYGFMAALCAESETTYYSESTGVPQLVLDMATVQCNYTFATPEDITTSIVEARFDCPWLEESLSAKEEDLPRLEQILKNAEFGYMGACGYGAYLHLTLADGNTLTVVKGTDGCDSIAFGSYGGYFLGDRENTEFWHIFGLDEENHLPLSD